MTGRSKASILNALNKTHLLFALHACSPHLHITPVIHHFPPLQATPLVCSFSPSLSSTPVSFTPFSLPPFSFLRASSSSSYIHPSPQFLHSCLPPPYLLPVLRAAQTSLMIQRLKEKNNDHKDVYDYYEYILGGGSGEGGAVDDFLLHLYNFQHF